MNGVHDMGGMHNFGRVVPEVDEPAFHEEWERRAFSLTLAMGASGAWNIDQSRSARESLPPASYLTSSYYRIWVEALENLMMERGLVDAAELDDGRPRLAPRLLPRVLAKADVAGVLARGAPTEREATRGARFAVGDRVHTKVLNPTTHTRMPRYIRGRTGTVTAVHGVHVFADASALGRSDAEWLYNVRFDGSELWGADSTAAAVHVDCWEPYLESA
ncbi:MAG: nitrile hydratase subunit beta [Betaproteobacteria bacterium]